MDKLKQGWPLIVVTVLLNLAATFIVLGYNNGKDNIDGKADVEYVDNEISHVNSRIDAHEKSQEKTMAGLKEASKKDFESVSKRLDDVIEYQKQIVDLLRDRQ